MWEPFLICLLIGPDWLCWLSRQIKNGSHLTVHLKLEKLKAMPHIFLTYFFRPQAVWEEKRNSRKARFYYTTMWNFAHRFPFILFVYLNSIRSGQWIINCGFNQSAWLNFDNLFQIPEAKSKIWAKSLIVNGHEKFLLYSCRVSQSEEGKEKKILIYYESERQMLNTNNTQGVS